MNCDRFLENRPALCPLVWLVSLTMAAMLAGTGGWVFAGQPAGPTNEASNAHFRSVVVAVNEERGEMYSYINAGEPYAEGEGWKWFETCGWEDITGRLFGCAGEVARALGGK